MPRNTNKNKHEENKNIPPPQLPFGDINQLMKSAQQLAQNMSLENNGELDKMDINQMFEHVSSSLFNTMEQSGNKIDSASKEQMKVLSRTMLGQVLDNVDNAGTQQTEEKNFQSDIDLSGAKQNIDKIPVNNNDQMEVLDSDEEADEIKPYVEDLKYKLQVSLDEVYTGKVKKLAITRERIVGKSINKEKRKFEIPIIPGMKNGQEIRFNREGNEKLGHLSGDVVVSVEINGHDTFERIGSNIFTVKNISLYESYAAGRGDIKIVIKHLNGIDYVLKTDGQPLHTKDGARKIKGCGMPVYDKNRNNKQKYGDMYVRFNLILPSHFEGDNVLTIIEKLFPTLDENKDSILKSDAKYTSNMKEILLDEITKEDMEQLEYEDESSSDDSEESDSESGSE